MNNAAPSGWDHRDPATAARLIDLLGGTLELISTLDDRFRVRIP